MNSRRLVTATYWLGTFIPLAAIVLLYRRWLHVNPTTVALTLLLYVLIIASRLSLRYAVVASVIATACYNFYFLPPIGTFTIADPQNWLTLFAFLVTSVIGSRLSETAREETEQARARQAELEVLFTLSRELLQTDNVADLLDTLPLLISVATRAQSCVLYLLDSDRFYQVGDQRSLAIEAPHFGQLALTLPVSEVLANGEVHIPLRAGVKPRGLLRLVGVRLSTDTLQAIGGLASISLDRAQALAAVARNEASKESERLRNLILDSITHELRTPLTSIKGATSALLSLSVVTEEDRRELLTIIDEEADRLNRLVGQAVEMAQIEAREVHMDIAPVNLLDIVEIAKQDCSWVAEKHSLSIEVPDLPQVDADPVMIAKVLCNLLENAAKYSSDHSPIRISAERIGGYVITHVADRGVGIDPAEQSLIFDRLYRSRSHSQQKPGTGMGLPISRAIIESHQGQLKVTSQPKHGSVFSFSLPLSNIRPA